MSNLFSSTTYGSSEFELSIQQVLNNIPTPNDEQQYSAANVQYVQQYTADHGGGSNKPINELPNQSANYDAQGYKITGLQIATQNTDAVNKLLLDQQIGIERQRAMTAEQQLQDQINSKESNKIVAIGDITSQTQMSQNGRFTYLQGQLKEELRNGFTKTYQPLIASDNFQITDNNQYVTYSQAVLQTDSKIEEEKQQREEADQNLQNQVNEIKLKPLNEWYVPMSNSLNNNTFEMMGNRISGMPAQLLNFTSRTDASSIGYVNDSINQLATDTIGQISNAEIRSNTYTDQEVFNLKTQTELDLAGKQDIVPLNEIPLPQTALNMNSKRITNLAQPAFVDGDLDALPYGFAKTVFATKTELSDYITIQDANDAFRSRISTLSDIQQEEPAPLNMQNLRITNCANAINPTDVPTYQQVINGQGISQEYADTHYLGINIPLNQINTPISVLSMNNQNIIDLPLVPLGMNNACSVQYATGLSNQAVANPISDINMNLAHKVTGLPIASNPSDAVRYDQLPDLNNYLTQTQADTLYMAKNESLSGIQNNNPQELNMQSQKIVNCLPGVNPNDVVIVSQLPTVQSSDQIINQSGYSYVKVNQDQSISLTSNNSEIISVQPTLVTCNQPIFSTTSPAFDPSNQLLTKQQNSLFFMDKNTTLNNIPFADGDISANGFRIRDILNPTESHMAATKNYVDQAQNSVQKIQNTSQTSNVTCNTDGTVSVKASNGSSSVVFSSQNNTDYKIANSGSIEIQSNSILTLNASQYVQSTTPIISNSTASSDYQLLNRLQNDGRYYQNTEPLNSILSPNDNVQMNGYTLSNIRDAIDDLEPTNLAQVTSLIANSGFKNKIQSQSGHAYVSCLNGSDNIEIKANNANSNLLITAQNDTQYKISNDGDIFIDSLNHKINFNQSAIEINGSAGMGNISCFAPIMSSAINLDLGQQILNRDQNDARYLSQQTTNLSNIPPPDSSVSFGGQLLRNLQTPILGTDASTKAYIDSTLTNYPTTAVLQANYVSKTDASATYRTEQQVQTQIQSNLQNYDTSLAVTDKINMALIPYSTSSQIASTYQPQSTPFTSIVNNSINSVEAQSNNLGIKIYGGLSNVKTNILDIFAPAGQSSGTCEIQAKNKLNIVANSGLTSIMAGVGVNNSTLTIKSAGDTLGQIQYDNLVIGGRSTAPQLQLSSGHDASNNGYSLINNANSVAVNTLQLSPEISANVLTGNNLLMYANTAAVTIKNQFNKNVGLTFTQSSPQSNEFVTKSYCDATYSNNSIQTTIQDSTQTYRVICTNANVQLYTGLNSGQPSIYFRKSLDGTYINYTEIANVNANQGLLLTLPTVFTQIPQINSSQIISQNSGDARYLRQFNAYLNDILPPQGDYSLAGFKLTNLASGTIASGNTSSVTGGNVYDYIATLPSVITEQVYTVTIFGSTTNGFQFSNLPNTPQNNVVQVQRIKGSGALMITSSTVIAQSQTLVDSFASLQFQVSNANIRVTQCVPYTTSAFSTPGQQNIASLTFSQQAINATNTCIQLYKPVSNQGSSAFILYVYVDQF